MKINIKKRIDISIIFALVISLTSAPFCVLGDSFSENTISNNYIDDDFISSNMTSDILLSEDSLSEDSLSEDSLSEDSLFEDSPSVDSIPSYGVDGTLIVENEPCGMTVAKNNSETLDDSVKYNLYDTDLDGHGDYAVFSGNGFLRRRLFINDSYLKTVIIQEGVKGIYNEDFKNCSNLEYVKIPSTVYRFGSGSQTNHEALTGCPKLKTVGPVDGGYNIEYNWHNSTVKQYESSNDTLGREIPKNAFYNNSSIESCIIAEGIRMIGDNALNGCSSLSKVKLPNSLNLMEEHIVVVNSDVFDGCPLLKTAGPAGGDYNVEFSFANRIPARALAIDSLESIVLPEGIRKLTNACLAGTAIESISFPSSLEYIGAYAFQDCNNLKSVTLPGTIKSIDVGTFYSCTSLETVDIKYGISEIPEDAFSGCVSLDEIKVPSSVTSIFFWSGMDNGVYTEKPSIEGSVNLKIIGYPGTAAYNYATERGLTFEINPEEEEIPAENNDPENNEVKIGFTQPVYYVVIGKKTKVSLNVGSVGGNVKSSKKSIATVSKTGVVKGLKKGKTVISSTYNGVNYSCVVQVVKKPTLKGKNIIKKNKTVKFKVKDGGGDIIWSSSKPSVATVDQSGRVTGVAKGKANIIAVRNGVKMKMKITVK